MEAVMVALRAQKICVYRVSMRYPTVGMRLQLALKPLHI